MNIERLDHNTLRDERGNIALVAYYGSETAAIESLRSLVDCRNCVNCQSCLACESCAFCSHCSGCVDSVRCVDCLDSVECCDCSQSVDLRRCANVFRAVGLRDRGVPPVPVVPDIHRALFAAVSAPGALITDFWHCGTSHCRGGWAVTLAGKAGEDLERATTPLYAALRIYRESDPGSLATVPASAFFEPRMAVMMDSIRELAEASP